MGDLLYIKRPNSSTVDFIRDGSSAMLQLDFKKGDGILPAIAQDYKSGKVLMLAYMNDEAYQLTLQTGEAHYWSRTRGEIWHKGETSGNIQVVREILVDCDHDAILLKVEQVGGAACHLGYESCFHNKIDKHGGETTIGERIFDPERIYKK